MPKFTCQDLNGLEIICPDERWQHIVDHHFEMEGQEDLIQDVINKPDFINQDKNFANRNCYYKKLKVPLIGNSYVRVVIEKRTKKGAVISAFSSASPTEGEKVIWKKK